MDLKNVESKKFLISVIIIVMVVSILNFTGMLYDLNPFINKIFPPVPDKRCQVDSDCIFAVSSEISMCLLCSSCMTYNAATDEIITVNKDWKPCLFTKPSGYGCGMCITEINNIENFEPKCLNNECIKSRK